MRPVRDLDRTVLQYRRAEQQRDSHG